MVPIVQVNVAGVLEVKFMFGLVPLQMLAVVGLVTAGVGFTVIVMVKGEPTHDPVVEVGVIKYSTVPAVVLLGFVNT